jgi:hypothetical protein
MCALREQGAAHVCQGTAQPVLSGSKGDFIKVWPIISEARVIRSAEFGGLIIIKGDAWIGLDKNKVRH